jgi:hypothetical protein
LASAVEDFTGVLAKPASGRRSAIKTAENRASLAFFILSSKDNLLAKIAQIRGYGSVKIIKLALRSLQLFNRFYLYYGIFGLYAVK